MPALNRLASRQQPRLNLTHDACRTLGRSHELFRKPEKNSLSEDPCRSVDQDLGYTSSPTDNRPGRNVSMDGSRARVDDGGEAYSACTGLSLASRPRNWISRVNQLEGESRDAKT